MSSKLYKQARGRLNPLCQEKLDSFEIWLEQYEGVSIEHRISGKKLLNNLINESHLIGNGSWGDDEELRNFLQCICSCLNGELLECYEQACGAYELRGLKIYRAHLPRSLLRYSTSKKLIDKLVDNLIPSPNWRLRYKNGLLSMKVVFEEIENCWDTRKLLGILLAKGKVVFATFEVNPRFSRDNPKLICEALALSILRREKRREAHLTELLYSTDAVRVYRFPTVADAGINDLFEPATEISPDPANTRSLYGWTKPINDSLPPQPEIVHANASLIILSVPPRYIGRIY